MQKYLFILSVLFLFVACDKEENLHSNEDNYLIVGLTYGECLGNCSHLYKLEMDQVFADTEDKWWNGTEELSFEKDPLDDTAALASMKALAENFPNFLIDSDESRFGCPDCGDWGALHVIRKENGQETAWTLDNQIESNPEEIQIWAKDMQTLIYRLIN